MFKVVKSSTWEAKNKEVRDLKNDLKIVKERENQTKALASQRGEKIASLEAEKDACRAMRHDLQKKLESREYDNNLLNVEIEGLRAAKRDLNKQIEALKADLAKQGDELVVAKDEVKQLKRSLETVSENMHMFKNQAKELSSKVLRFEEQESRESDLITAVQSAITEMRKTRKGRTSLNNVRAFEILKSAIGQK
jgi:chromosome segregation ATPase